jgi:methionyl-tRNA synthetase
MSLTEINALASQFVWLILIWTIPWKGVALWRAARNGHKKWFGFLLVINTLAILEIIYIFCFSKKKEEIKPIA